jgi:uncharacterized protein GlcG (DUF336 family)
MPLDTVRVERPRSGRAGIGAAGAPGAKLDDACARAGMEKIKDRLQ